MKTYLTNRVVLASLLLLLCFTGKAQNNASTNNKSISIMLSDKADMDCMETELLPGMKNVSLVYSNQHSGIMILKSDFQDKESLLKILNDCVANKNEKIGFEVIEPVATYYLSNK